jgi:hypothetical protein
VTTPETNTAIAPALTALGGWSDAEWFCPTILTDLEVSGFTFPKLPGLRKQSFHVLDRATMAKTPSRASKMNAAKPQRNLPGKAGSALAGFGATRAIACCQVKLLFETGPILFFGEFPAGKLKQRSANKMRRELIDIGHRGCILRVEEKSVIGMFWPSAETGITAFVNAARPDYPLHSDFEKTLTGPSTSKGTKPASASPNRPDKRANDREAQLLQEIASLRQQIDTMQQGQSPLLAMQQLGLDEARLKSMLKLLHPDKHGNSEEATNAAKWLNNLRDLLKGRTL